MKKLVVAALSILIMGSKAQNLSTNLVICMPMNGNANDFSGNSNNGTIIGGVTPTTDRNGNANSAYFFDGTSGYIDVPASASINGIELNDELSISLWCRVDGFLSGNLFPILEKYEPTGGVTPYFDQAWAFTHLNPGVFPTSGGPPYDNMYFFNMTGGALYNAYAANTSPFVIGNWDHYVMTFSKLSGTFKYYKNGTLVTSTAIAPAALQILSTTGSIRIGFSQAGPDEYANGAMDELRVYSRELTAGEIAGLSVFSQTLSCASTATFVNPPPPVPSCCLGNYCANTKIPLTGNYEIPLNGFNFNFSGNSTPNQEKVNIGLNCGASLLGKFNVTTNLSTDPGAGHSHSIYSTNTNATPNTNKTGVYGSAINTVLGINRGIWGYASSLKDARGVYGHCGKATTSYGGYFESVSSTGNTTNYGIYAKALNATTNWAGFFDGNVRINGSAPPSSGTTPPGGLYALTVNGNALTTAGAWYLSDKRFKDKIVPLTDVISKLTKIQGYNYVYKTEEFKERNFNTGNQIGLIAQELKEVFPELVKEDTDGYLAVNYQGMVPLLLEAAKEQQKRIESQQQQIDELSASVKSLIAKNNSNATTTGIPVNLSDKNTIVLNQNVPNPFAESTVISYNLPTEFNRAQIIFTNNSGVVIKTVDLKEKGVGSLNVFANDLTHGLYSYSLIVDGKVIDTKKMVKE